MTDVQLAIARQRDCSGQSEVADLIEAAEVDLSLVRGVEQGGHTNMEMARKVIADAYILEDILEEQGNKRRLVVVQVACVLGLEASLVEGSDDASDLLGILEAVDTDTLRHTSVEADAQEDAVILRP